MKKIFYKFLIGFIALYVVALLAMILFQEKIQFQPAEYSEGSCTKARELGYQLKQYGNSNHFFHRERPGAKAWYVIFHGTGGQACSRVYLASELKEKNLHIVLAEYPGYGPSGGDIAEKKILAGAIELYDHLKKTENLDVILFGESLGTGVASYVASQRDVSALILQAPYSSVAAVAKNRYPIFPVHLLIRNPFNAYTWVPQVTAPVLIIHGSQDRTVPIRFGRQIFKKFANSRRKEFIEIQGAGHNDLQRVDYQKFWQSITHFLTENYSRDI